MEFAGIITSYKSAILNGWSIISCLTILEIFLPFEKQRGGWKKTISLSLVTMLLWSVDFIPIVFFSNAIQPILKVTSDFGLLIQKSLGIYRIIEFLNQPKGISLTFISFLLFCFSTIIWDFFQYWVHRIQHDNDKFWTVAHEYHHSCELGTHLTYRHNVAELVLGIIGIQTTHSIVSNILGMKYVLPGYFWTFLTLWYFIQHSNLRLPIIETGIFYNYNHHRLHHDRNHTNYNFGQFTIIWDKLFGTYKNPVLLKKIKFDSLIDTCPQQISWFRSYKELYKSLFIILKFIKNKISSFFLYM